MTWFDVIGYEDRYQVTRTGLVRSKSRYVNSPAAGGRRFLNGKMLKLAIVKGYPAIQSNVDGARYTLYLHRILAELFIPNPDGKPSINHIDGDKANFALENLEWCSHKENMRHAFNTGLATAPNVGPGEQSPSAKLNDDAVRDIKRRLRAGETHRSLATEYGISTGTIGFIARGETWGHVTI